MASEQVPRDAAVAESERPLLLIFYSARSGRSRRVEGFLSQVLQRRKNHETFTIVRVEVDERPDLAHRFGVSETPTLFVIDGRKVKRRLVAPNGTRELQRGLAPWLH